LPAKARRLDQSGFMRTNTKRLPARSARPTRFSLKRLSATASRAETNAKLTALKDRLARRHLAVSPAAIVPAVQRAANDAASLAWATSYPLLVLPVLLDEKVVVARCQTSRQADIHKRSAALLAVAA